MFKKITFPLIIVAMVIQFAVAISMIGYSQTVERQAQKYGNEYKIDINIASVMNGEVIFSPEDFDLWYPLAYNEYVVLGVNEDGKAFCVETSTKKPKSGDYLRPSQRNGNLLDAYKVDYDGAILSSAHYDLYMIDAHITAKVYNGDMAVTGLYIENLPVDQWLAEFDED